MRREAVGPIALVLAFGVLVWALVARASPISDDDPRWDCTTMGNHVCGVSGEAGETYLVTFDADGKPVSLKAAG